MNNKIKNFFIEAFAVVAYVWSLIFHGLPTILLFFGFWLLAFHQYLPGLLCWVLSELIQIKNHLEKAEIIVREED